MGRKLRDWEASCAVICGWLKRLKACTSPGQCNLCQMSPGCMCECSISHRLCVCVCVCRGQSELTSLQMLQCCVTLYDSPVIFSFTRRSEVRVSYWKTLLYCIISKNGEQIDYFLTHTKDLDLLLGIAGQITINTSQLEASIMLHMAIVNIGYFDLSLWYHCWCFLLNIWDWALMTTAF